MDAASQDVEIAVRVRKIAQLFHSLDPSPFRERELDVQAEEFIVDWARETPPDAPLAIVVHLPAAEAESPYARDVPEAIRGNFAYRVEQTQGQMRELFRQGRTALLIGLPLLAACLVGSQVIVKFAGQGTLARIVGESLVILGWVANWRPMEIFLYDWLPIRRRKRLYERLARARIEVRPY